VCLGRLGCIGRVLVCLEWLLVGEYWWERTGGRVLVGEYWWESIGGRVLVGEYLCVLGGYWCVLSGYWVTTISRQHKIIGLFCKRAL